MSSRRIEEQREGTISRTRERSSLTIIVPGARMTEPKTFSVTL